MSESETDFSREERGPIRTCVGCRTRAPKDELVRLALPSLSLGAEGLPEVAVDLQGKLPGRGVHLHPTRACALAAIKRGGLAQALKRAPRITGPQLVAALAARHRDRAMALLGVAKRAGCLAIGADAVREAMTGSRGGRLELVLVASDADGREEWMAPIERLQASSGSEQRQYAIVLESVEETSPVTSEASGPPFGTKGALGRMFGRDEVAVLGVLDRGIADHVAQAMSVASELTTSQRTEAR